MLGGCWLLCVVLRWLVDVFFLLLCGAFGVLFVVFVLCVVGCVFFVNCWLCVVVWWFVVDGGCASL